MRDVCGMTKADRASIGIPAGLFVEIDRVLGRTEPSVHRQAARPSQASLRAGSSEERPGHNASCSRETPGVASEARQRAILGKEPPRRCSSCRILVGPLGRQWLNAQHLMGMCINRRRSAGQTAVFLLLSYFFQCITARCMEGVYARSFALSIWNEQLGTQWNSNVSNSSFVDQRPKMLRRDDWFSNPVTNVVGCVCALLIYTCGALSDRFGRKRILVPTSGLLVFVQSLSWYLMKNDIGCLSDNRLLPETPCLQWPIVLAAARVQAAVTIAALMDVTRRRGRLHIFGAIVAISMLSHVGGLAVLWLQLLPPPSVGKSISDGLVLRPPAFFSSAEAELIAFKGGAMAAVVSGVLLSGVHETLASRPSRSDLRRWQTWLVIKPAGAIKWW